MSIKWCPTGDMIVDFVTKPLQGASFHKFRDLTMGVVPTVTFVEEKKDKVRKAESEPRKGKKSLVPQKAAPQECVGKKQKSVTRGKRLSAGRSGGKSE